MVEEIGCFEKAMLVSVLGALKRVHVAGEGETVGGKFGKPELRVQGVHFIPVRLRSLGKRRG